MIAASMIFCLLGVGFVALAALTAYLVWREPDIETVAMLTGVVLSLLIAAGAFYVADVIWRAA